MSLIVGGSYCTFSNLSPLIAFYNDPPILAKCSHYHYQQIFAVIFISIFMNQLCIKHFTTHVRWSTVYYSIHCSLNIIWWDHQIFYFHPGCCDFPDRSFYYHTSTLSKSRKIPTPYKFDPLQLSAKEYNK